MSFLKISISAGLLCLCGGLLGAPVNYEEADVTYNTFTKRSGNWDDPKNWSSKHIPNAEEAVIIRNNTEVTLSTKVPEVQALHLGGLGTSILTVSEGAQLETVRKLHVNRNTAEAAAHFVIEGGTVRVGTDEKFSAAKMYIGTNLTHSSRAWTTISAGTFIGGIVIGNNLPNTGTGTLSIIGTAPVIKAKIPRDSIIVQPYGHIEFILNEEGVSTLDYTRTGVRFDKGSLIKVNGSKYAGGAAVITLIDCKKISNKGARIECEGFSEKYDAQVIFDKGRGLLLKIKTK